MLGTLPSLVSMLPAAQAPYSVPRVSNMSTMQNASMVVRNMMMKLLMPCSAMYGLKSKPSVKTLPNAWVPKSLNAPKKSEDRLGATAVA